MRETQEQEKTQFLLEKWVEGEVGGKVVLVTTEHLKSWPVTWRWAVLGQFLEEDGHDQRVRGSLWQSWYEGGTGGGEMIGARLVRVTGQGKLRLREGHACLWSHGKSGGKTGAGARSVHLQVLLRMGCPLITGTAGTHARTPC